MPIRPIEISHSDFIDSKHLINDLSPSKYGLLGVPNETLTHITAYFDPPALLALALVHSTLNEHVKNDHTWYRAFLLYFLGIKPDSDIEDNRRTTLLRRSESTWKKEYLVRYALIRRWSRSRTVTVEHVPLHSTVHTMRLLSSTGVLASSLKYGIVSRSDPLKGRVLPGFLSPSNNGLGIGNPNLEFTPNVTACDILPDGGTARVAWGLDSGEVTIATAARAMDGKSRPAAQIIRCNPNDEHDGKVECILWDEGGGFVVSGGKDGRVKVWDFRTLTLVWSTEPKLVEHVPDRIVLLASSCGKGVVVAGTASGDIVLLRAPGNEPLQRIDVKCPLDVDDTSLFPVLSLAIDPASLDILVGYQNHPHLFRVRAGNDSTVATFAEEERGVPATAILPQFASQPGETSFFIIGEALGHVSFYHWDKLPSANTTTGARISQPFRRFEAHTDGCAVTALAWNGTTLAVGNARGKTAIFDGYTFEHLRSFTSHPRTRPRGFGGSVELSVRQVLLGQERDMMVMSAGDRVMAWKAGPVPKHESGGVRGRNTTGDIKRRQKQAAKGYEHLLLKETVNESLCQLDEESYARKKVLKREKEHRDNLDRLGLDEIGAVEYALMLSRDEAIAQQAARQVEDEGVFDGDFDDIPQEGSNNSAAGPSRQRSSPSPPTQARPLSPSSASPSPNSRRFGAWESSRPAGKVQVSPRYRPEPREAGWPDSTPSPSPPREVPSPEHFPPVSTSPIAVARTPSSVGSSSAWNTPLTSRTPNRSGPGSFAGPSSLSRLPSPAGKGAYADGSGPGSFSGRSASASATAGTAGHRNGDEEDDPDLKLAIELSLAEARSLNQG